MLQNFAIIHLYFSQMVIIYDDILNYSIWNDQNIYSSHPLLWKLLWADLLSYFDSVGLIRKRISRLVLNSDRFTKVVVVFHDYHVVIVVLNVLDVEQLSATKEKSFCLLNKSVNLLRRNIYFKC